MAGYPSLLREFIKSMMSADLRQMCHRNGVQTFAYSLRQEETTAPSSASLEWALTLWTAANVFIILFYLIQEK